MVKKEKIKEKIREGVREIKRKVAELEELEEELDDELVDVAGFDEGGIFDEDLEHVEEVDDVSDFDIGENILTASPAIESWAGKDLEEEVRRGHNEWDWKPEAEFVGGDIYNPSSGSGDVYGAGSSDVYSTGERGEGVYGAAGDGAYKSDSGEGSYASQGGSGGIKSYADVEKDRRSGKSGLEIAGFEDKERSKHRETHGLSKYQAGGKAA